MFLYYLAAGVLTGGIGLYYFYLNLGYGSWQGGLAATLISVVYVVGNVSAQALYPVLAKKMSKQKMLTIFSIVGLVAYAAFFLLCFPIFGEHPIAYNDYSGALKTGELFISDMGAGLGWALGGTMFLYYLIPLVFFFTQGLIYMIILVMFQDAIDYNEWKFGERKEAVAFAWRPLDVKLSSALLRGFQYLIFAIAGVSGYFAAVSDAEGVYNRIANTAGDAATIAAAEATRNQKIFDAWQSVTPGQLVTYGVITILVIGLSMLGAFLLLHFKYKVDEDTHAQIVKELEERHIAAEKEEEAKGE
jgi:melibiose permease/lactose/raffinose/galactose permease